MTEIATAEAPAPAHILIVDDDDAIRQMLSLTFEEEGCRVATARHGQEALHYLTANPVLPKLILLDLMMPIMTGFEFLTVKTQHAHIDAIPVIAFSAYPEAQADLLNLPIAGFLPKPLQPDHLQTVVQHYCHDEP